MTTPTEPQYYTPDPPRRVRITQRRGFGIGVLLVAMLLSFLLGRYVFPYHGDHNSLADLAAAADSAANKAKASAAAAASDKDKTTPSPSATTAAATPSGTPSVTPSDTASATPSATASSPMSSAPAAGATAPATPTCVPMYPSQLAKAVTLNRAAGSQESGDLIAGLTPSNYTQFYYMGDPVAASDVVKFITESTCAGKTSVIDLDAWFGSTSDDNVKALIQAIDGTPNLSGYSHSQNAPGVTVDQFNHRTDVIKSVSSKPVIGLIDYNRTADPREGIRISKQFHADQLIPVYLPWKVHPDWPVTGKGGYFGAGAQSKAINGNSSKDAAVGVQAFDVGQDGLNNGGYTEVGLPSPAQVQNFIADKTMGGASKTLVYTQETASDDKDYLTEIVGTHAVPNAIPTPVCPTPVK